MGNISSKNIVISVTAVLLNNEQIKIIENIIGILSETVTFDGIFLINHDIKRFNEDLKAPPRELTKHIIEICAVNITLELNS